MHTPQNNSNGALLGNIPYRSSGIFPNEYLAELGNTPLMEITHEFQLAKIDAGIKRLGITQHALEKQAGIAIGSIKDLRRGKTSILRADKWQKILHIIEKTKSQVPIIGEIGAGTEIFPVDHVPLMQQGMREKDQDYVNCEFVDAPPGVYPAGVVAVRVRGDSMLPFLSAGAIIYYEQRITGGCNDYLGSLIVAQIKDGPALLKTLRRGYAYGRFNLESYNAPLIEDVELEWCAKVAFIKPA